MDFDFGDGDFDADDHVVLIQADRTPGNFTWAGVGVGQGSFAD